MLIFLCCLNLKINKNAFQWDAYRPLVDRIPACTGQGRGCLPVGCLLEGVCLGGIYLEGGVCLGGVCPGEVSAQGRCLPLVPGGVSQHTMGQTPPCGQKDTCENKTLCKLHLRVVIINRHSYQSKKFKCVIKNLMLHYNCFGWKLFPIHILIRNNTEMTTLPTCILRKTIKAVWLHHQEKIVLHYITS